MPYHASNDHLAPRRPRPRWHHSPGFRAHRPLELEDWSSVLCDRRGSGIECGLSNRKAKRDTGLLVTGDHQGPLE
jgi:hypothetical protein